MAKVDPKRVLALSGKIKSLQAQIIDLENKFTLTATEFGKVIYLSMLQAAKIDGLLELLITKNILTEEEVNGYLQETIEATHRTITKRVDIRPETSVPDDPEPVS